jgi:large subunit ribosomal protein L20
VPRVKRGSKRRERRKKILSLAKGYFQAKSKLFRYAKEAVERGQKFAYVGRKLKKRDFRSLWIIRIGAASRLHGLSYSKLMHGLKLAGIDLNRKVLSEMAIHDPKGFEQVAAKAKVALETQPAVEKSAA